MLDPPDESFVRGVMVILHGLVSKPELNGRHGLVLGPLASGRMPSLPRGESDMTDVNQ